METLPRREAATSCDDVAAFQRVNRCPLWRGRLNRWMVRRTLRGKPTDAEILAGARDVLAFWFAEERLWGSATIVGNVRAMARRKALEFDAVAATADFLSPSPLMLGDSFASLELEFIYFGRCVDMPWPVVDAAGAWLPIDCVWALDLVGAPRDA